MASGDDRTVTAAQAGYITHHNERAVRWRISHGALPATRGEDGHMRVDLADLERIPGWHVDLARLDELQRRDPGMVATLEARIQALEARVETLERLNARVAPSRDRQAASPVWDDASHSPIAASDHDEPVSASFAFPPRRAPVHTVTLSSELPPGWVAWRSFAKLHGMAPQTVKGAIEDGRLPAQRGRWKVDRVYVKGALDEQGQATFFRLWGGREDFRRCDDCPHTPVLADSAESVS